MQIIQKRLKRDLKWQFGSKGGPATEKLQRLFFMLRDNQDVFQVFLDNFFDLLFQLHNGPQEEYFDLPEAMVHFMFQDLTKSQMNTKLVLVIHYLTSRTFVKDGDAPA